MRIKRFYIKNFKAIAPKEVCFDFSDNILVLIGENNVGKSTVLSAINLFFDNTKKLPKEAYYNFQCDKGHAVIITVVFNKLTENDKEHIAVKSFIGQEDGEDVWTLKKTYFYTSDTDYECEYVAVVNGEEKSNPGGRQTNVDDLFTNEKMQKVYIPAVQNISEIVDGKKKSPFSQIFQLLLSEELRGTDEYNQLLDALRAYAALFEKGTKHKKVQEIEDLITSKLKRIIEASGLIDVELPPDEKLLPTPTLSTDDGRSISVSPSDQGHGLQRSLIFALLELYAESVSSSEKEVGVTNLILIEEPEIYMHPQMERKISEVLYKLAESKKVQVICTTHSPIFIKVIEKSKSLVRIVRDDENKFDVIQIQKSIFADTDDEKEERKKLEMITQFDPYVNELFFAKRVVLVEGDTEFAIFPISADLIGLFSTPENVYKKHDIAIINCRSRDSIPSFQRVLNHFQIPYVVVHDLEGEARNQGTNKKILDLLTTDENQRYAFDPKIDSILGITDGGKRWFKAIKKIKELHSEEKLEEKLGESIRFVYGIGS